MCKSHYIGQWQEVENWKCCLKECLYGWDLTMHWLHGLGVLEAGTMNEIKYHWTKVRGGHSEISQAYACRLDVRKYSFTHDRVVDVGNSLDDNVIACDSLNVFKIRLDKFMHGRGFM